MKVSTKTRYGLRAMIDLAQHYKGKPVLVKEIAKRQKISENYLQQIMLLLKKGGLVASISGAKGGYMLAKAPSKITALDIVSVLEGTLSPVACLDHKGFCARERRCPSKNLWMKARKSLTDVLAQSALDKLAAQDKF